MAIEFLSSISITGTTSVSSIANDNSSYTGILVWDGGNLKYRTTSQILSDIGATGNTGTVTSVTVEGSSGLSGSGTVTTSGTITLTNSDKGSSQSIYKNIATQSGTATANTNNDTLTITGTGGTTTSRIGDTITINSTDTTTNNYVSSLSFNTGTGVLTAARSGLSSLTVDLDGRYLELTGGTLSGDLTISGGDIILGGTGRIQGIDTVSSGTDAANKTYVDTAVAGVPQGDITNVSTTSPITGGGSSGSVTIAHANSGATAGSYTNANVTVNATGHVTSVSNGSDNQGVTSVATTNGITGGTITSTGTIQLDSTVVRTTGNQTIAGNKTLTGTTTLGNTYQAYHQVATGDYYYDSYDGTKNLRWLVQGAKSDIIRYQSYSNTEYWNGTGWVSWTQTTMFNNILDGQKATSSGASITNTTKKFRFEVSANTGWPTTAILWVETSWSGATWPGLDVTVEEWDTTTSSWSTNTGASADFTSSNGFTNWGLMGHVVTSLHTGDTLTRITMDFGALPTSGSYTTVPLLNVMITSNYSGLDNTVFPFTVDYNKNLTTTGGLYAAGGNSTEWNTAFDNSVTAIGDSGTSTTTITLTQQDGGTLSTSFSNPQGTVTSVATGTGLTGGTITSTGTLSLATAGPGAAVYGSTSNQTKIDTITLDAYGRVTAVATGATGQVNTVATGNSSTLTSSGTTEKTLTPVTAAVSSGSAALATGAQIQTAIDTALTGVLSYQGTWNASTNSPTLASATGTPGYYYIVSVAGSTNLDGITDWAVGDWAVFSDLATDAWQKIDNTQVGSVTGSGSSGRVAYWNSTSGITSDAGLTFNGSTNALTVGGAVTWSGGGSTESNSAYDNMITGISDSGSSTKTITLTQQDGGTLTTSFSIPQGTMSSFVINTAAGLDGAATVTNGGTVNLSLNLNELGAGGTLVATDSLVAVNGTASNKQLISSIPLSIFNNNSGWTSNTGTTTASNTQTFTNKSGNISQWTNDSGYTTNTGDITGVTAGSGISGGGTSGTVTVTNSDKGSSQNIFKNIAVSGQSTVVADSNNDTLTLVAAGGMTITTNASTDTITFNPNDDNSNYYVSGASYSDGTLELTRNGLSALEATGFPTNNNQLTNGSGYTTNTGTTTASNVQTFTNKGGNISQWTNNSGYTTNVGDITGVTAGTGLSGGGTSGAVTLTLDLGELAVGGTLIATDYLIAENGGVDNRQLISSIPLSIFSNNAGWTSNSGDITGVTAGSGISGGGTSGTVTITNSAPNVSTNLTTTAAATTLTVNSSDGTNAILPAATTTVAGVMTGADKSKLDGIAAGATNVTNNNQLTNGAGYITSYVNTTYTAGSGITLTGTVFSNAAPNIVQTTVSGNAGSATVLQTARTIAGVSFNGSANISLNNNAITNGAGYTTNVGDITGVTAGAGLSGGGTSGTPTVSVDYLGTDSIIKAAPTATGEIGTGDFVLIANSTGNVFETPLSTLPFSNNSGDITGVTAGNKLTGGGTSGTVTLGLASNNISQWTNDSDYTTNVGDITAVTAGTGLSGGGTSGSVTLTLDLGELEVGNTLVGTDYLIAENGGADMRQLVSSIPLSIFSNNSGWTSNTGTTTASNTQTFTNKSGNISQWSNNSGYTTNTGTTTASNSQTFTNKGGNISQWTNDSGYVTSSGGSMSSWILKEGNGTESTSVTNGETVTFAQGNGITSEMTSTSSGGTLTITNTKPNIVQTTVTGNAGTVTNGAYVNVSNNFTQIQKTTLSEPKLQLISNSSPSLTAGLGTQVGGQLLSFGTNYSQGGNRNNSYVGGYFRIDTRTGAESEFFNVQRIPAEGSETIIFKVSSTGSVVASGNITAFSDERLKDDIKTLDGSKVLDMRGVSYTKDGKAGSGVIAQELEKVAPELVMTNEKEDGMKSVAYGNLVGYLIEAVKDQQKQIDELKAQVNGFSN